MEAFSSSSCPINSPSTAVFNEPGAVLTTLPASYFIALVKGRFPSLANKYAFLEKCLPHPSLPCSQVSCNPVDEIPTYHTVINISFWASWVQDSTWVEWGETKQKRCAVNYFLLVPTNLQY